MKPWPSSRGAHLGKSRMLGTFQGVFGVMSWASEVATQ